MLCSKPGKVVLIFSMFHALVLGIKILTSLVGGPVRWSGLHRDSQGSVYTLVVFPFPIVFPSFLFSSSFPIMIALQPWAAELGAELSRKEEELQYLPFRNRASMQSRFVRILQLNFARRASLNAWMSLKRNPLIFLLLLSFSHETHHIFFFSIFVSHQKRVRVDCILLQRLVRSLKHYIV